MKSTGIIRKVDELGRVVIPIELRRSLGIRIKDAMEIYVDNDKIVLKKYEPNMACQITGDISEDNQSFANGKFTLSKEGAKILVEEIQSKFDLKD
ncbi:MAG TPA: AbrB/MazE/SpoVT family DNA-binding domain-containing protein [Bacillota bacterium]|nr:AbrB/MazE/SpoVT family DNA-binding domain-containing protein [Bacillota bacterium]